MKFPAVPLNVRTKILLLFLALALTSLAVTGLVALYFLGVVGEAAQQSSTELGLAAVRDSTTALTSLTQESMVRMAEDKAQLIDEIFWSSEMELDLLAAQAESVQDNPAYRPRIPSYSATDPPSNPLDGIVVLVAPGATVSENSDEYRALAGMDDLLAAVYRSDGDLVAVYAVTASGIMRSYPWEGTTGHSYDPRTRQWYLMATASEGPVWTDPYVDASGQGLIVTCARSVTTKYGQWVVASDVTIDQLNEYTNLTIGGKGYAMLVGEDGTVISRPGLAAGGSGSDASYMPENLYASTNSGLVAAAGNMSAGRTGIEQVTINGVPTYVAYAPVGTLNWSYAVFLPASEITAPIRDTESRIIASTMETGVLIREQTDRVLLILGILFVGIIAVVILLSWLLALMITRPVEQLREGATALGSGDLKFRVSISTGDEFEDLALAFNRMAEDLLISIENLKVTTAKNERYSRELEIAKEIQDSFLPESVPEIAGFDIAAATRPAMEIGGDFYDFIATGKGREVLVIADVSGKGVSAALYMALSRTLLHASGGADPDPSVAIQKTNRLLCDDDRAGMFVTVFYGVLDPAEKTLTYVNAGHNPTLIVRSDGSAAWLDKANGIALGVVPEVSIKPEALELASGDVLVLYTDGVTEAFNDWDEAYGEDRMVDCVRRNRSSSAETILRALLDEIRAFAGPAPQSDDITVVILRVS